MREAQIDIKKLKNLKNGKIRGVSSLTEGGG